MNKEKITVAKVNAALKAAGYAERPVRRRVVKAYPATAVNGTWMRIVKLSCGHEQNLSNIDYRLMPQSVICHRCIGKQLVAMVRKMRAKSVPDFLSKVASWAEKQVRRAEASGGRHVEAKIELIQDQALTLTAVAEGCESVSAIETRIANLFEDSDNTRREAVVCSSVHKAKGLEWNTVCMIDDTFKNKDKSQEEANIFYVAVTRAKRTLVRAN